MYYYVSDSRRDPCLRNRHTDTTTFYYVLRNTYDTGMVCSFQAWVPRAGVPRDAVSPEGPGSQDAACRAHRPAARAPEPARAPRLPSAFTARRASVPIHPNVPSLTSPD